MSLDIVAIEFLQQFRNPVFSALSVLLNVLFSHFVVLPATLALWAFYKKKKFFTIFAAALTTYAAAFVLKEVVARPRPDYIISEMVLDSSTNSFPSAHAAITFMLALMLYQKYPRLGKVLFVLAFLTAFTRVYSGAHYLTDVIAGAVLGLAVGYLFLRNEQKVLDLEAKIHKRLAAIFSS